MATNAYPQPTALDWMELRAIYMMQRGRSSGAPAGYHTVEYHRLCVAALKNDHGLTFAMLSHWLNALVHERGLYALVTSMIDRLGTQTMYDMVCAIDSEYAKARGDCDGR